ncbi:MAG: thioredoxin family protein [Desulfosalsimonadaceae bacterium]
MRPNPLDCFQKTLCILFFAALIAGSTASAEGSAVNWNSYETGIKKISEQNKKGFIHFYTDWCKYCKKMDQETFSDETVAAYLNENFVPIRINAEEQETVAEEYGVSRFPNNWFIAEDQSSLGKRPGFIPADALLHMLRYVNSESYKEMTFQDYMKNTVK